MCRLHKLIHKINGFRLLVSYDFTSCVKKVISLLAAVLLIVVVAKLSDDPASFLFDHHVHGEEFDQGSCDESGFLVEGAV